MAPVGLPGALQGRRLALWRALGIAPVRSKSKLRESLHVQLDFRFQVPILGHRDAVGTAPSGPACPLPLLAPMRPPFPIAPPSGCAAAFEFGRRRRPIRRRMYMQGRLTTPSQPKRARIEMESRDRYTLTPITWCPEHCAKIARRQPISARHSSPCKCKRKPARWARRED